MGIPGLCRFMQDSANVYFENYKLANCTLVIDGHSLSCQLYNWNQTQRPDARCNNCYGGDYDKYAHTVLDFFAMLQQAKVNPLVVFDGGFEAKKLPTILKRMQDKIDVSINMTPISERQQPWKVVFPLFLRETFKDVLRQLAVPMAMCQFEGDTEIASLAHALNCPVLTFDSDYFLFGVKYIPFKSIRNNIVEDPYKFIPCQVYKIENLLKKFPGLEQSTLHFLPVLLGNDYIEATVFRNLFKEISIGTSVDNIPLMLNWLATQTPEGVISKILESLETPQERERIINVIEKIVTSYQLTDTKLFQHFGIKTGKAIAGRQLNFSSVREKLHKLEEVGPTCSKLPRLDEVTPSDLPKTTIHTNVSHLEDDNSSSLVYELFEKNFTNCIYPSSFMDILTTQTYYCIPQVENRETENSHVLSFSILRAIHKILAAGSRKASDKKFAIVGRTIGAKVKTFIQPSCPVAVPSLQEIQELSLQDRRAVLFRILDLDHDKLIALFDQFPIEWHTFLISLTFAASKTSLNTSLIYCLVITFMILNYVDHKIGYYRSPQAYRRVYNSEMQHYRKTTSQISARADKHCFDSLLKQDCIVFMKKVILFFTVNPYDDQCNFNRRLLHKISQIQSCMLHIKYLNALLKMPYPDLIVHNIINGSFIYNFTTDVDGKKLESEAMYFKALFVDCPSLLAGLEHAMKYISQFRKR